MLLRKGHEGGHVPLTVCKSSTTYIYKAATHSSVRRALAEEYGARRAVERCGLVCPCQLVTGIVGNDNSSVEGILAGEGDFVV